MRDDTDTEIGSSSGASKEAEEKEPKSLSRGSAEGGRRRPREVEETEVKPPRLRPANIRHIGHGRLAIRGYHFNGHGAVVRVKGEDVAPLLAYQRVQRSCCGPRSPAVIRPLVKA